MGHSQPLFLYFRPFNTVDSQQMFNKFCRWLDSNCGPLVLEATALQLSHSHCPRVILYYKIGCTHLPRVINYIYLVSRNESQNITLLNL